MKILLATFWPIPQAGRIWPFMLQLKAQLERRGHTVDLLGSGVDEDNVYAYIVNEDRRIYLNKLLPLLKSRDSPHLSPSRQDNDLIGFAENRRSLYELSAVYLGLDDYDLIHTQDFISTSCIHRVRPAKSAIVATFHSSVAHEIRRHLRTSGNPETELLARALYNDLERNSVPDAEVMHVPNFWLRDILTGELRLPKEQIRVFQYGYDTDSFMNPAVSAERIQKPAGKKVILYIGKLVELKGLRFLIDALSSLKKIRKDWVLWIVGEGERQAHLREKSAVANLGDDIVFWGKKDNVLPFLKRADIFVLPSLIENQPLALIEAQLMGIPSVVSDVGGLPEMVRDGKTGLLVPPEDPDALCNQLNLLLADNRLRLRMGAKAKSHALVHWSLDQMILRILDAYREALNKRKEAGRHRTI
ncbi:glycosyltransferase family 4 protein [Cohnella faecalis]|uniref:Glycosyltransferase family 1 protein n=1 Tax=Cohnella faecalis TaxID=2315694 RepID=A0A398CTR0_9BACL|nr:glycosyltransferase family 4 protein [Cohnella faecalis]RIE04098.1 glycosyltransferase family 1 protein [Cohnella faecalis]